MNKPNKELFKIIPSTDKSMQNLVDFNLSNSNMTTNLFKVLLNYQLKHEYSLKIVMKKEDKGNDNSQPNKTELVKDIKLILQSNSDFIIKNFGNDNFLDFDNNRLLFQNKVYQIHEEDKEIQEKKDNEEIQETKKYSYFVMNLHPKEMPKSNNSSAEEIKIVDYIKIYYVKAVNQNMLYYLANKYISQMIFNYKSINKNIITCPFSVFFLNNLHNINDSFEIIQGIKYKNKYFNKNTSKLNCIYFNASFSYLVVKRKDTILDMINNLLGLLSNNKETSINEISDDVKIKLNECLSDKMVCTKYNKYKTYKILEVEFNSNPETQLVKYKGDEISLINYYRKAYNIEIKNKSQCLLVYNGYNANESEKIYLVPELCFLASFKLEGHNENDDKAIMKYVKDLEDKCNEITYISNFIINLNDANKKHNENKIKNTNPNHITPDDIAIKNGKKEIINKNKEKEAQLQIKDNEKEKENTYIIDIKSDFTQVFLLQKKSLLVNYRELPNVSYLFNKINFGKRKTIDFLDDEYLEMLRRNKIDLPLFECPPIPELAILVLENEQALAQELLTQITILKQNNEIKIGNIEIKKVSNKISTSNPFYEWEKALNRTITPSLIAMIIIIPDSSNVLYKFLKRFLLSSFPVPNQFIMSSTIKSKTYELPSIVNKAMFQLTTKVASQPWTIKDMPYSVFPSMIIGAYDTFVSNKVIVSLVASYNNSISRYFSTSKIIENYSEEESLKTIASLFEEALESFSLAQTILPVDIIFYRENTLNYNVEETYNKEARYLNSFMRDSSYNNKFVDYLKNTKFTYILVKRNYSFIKFYDYLETKKSILPLDIKKSRLVQKTISDERSEFYILLRRSFTSIIDEKYNKFNKVAVDSQEELRETRNNNYSCTYFKILTKDDEHFVIDLQDLSHKLHFLYYNSLQPISVPCVLQYAKKLAFIVGNTLCDEINNLIPSDRFKYQINSTYYI